MYEFVTEKNGEEFEKFMSESPYGNFLQASIWAGVKKEWDSRRIISRDDEGNVRAAMLLLIRKVPHLPFSYLYAPRGPVCNLHDKAVLKDLLAGAKILAKKYNAHNFKMDPDISVSDEEFLKIAKELGFTRKSGPTGFETIQCRFNYRLYIKDRTEDEVFMNLTQKCRYNVRVAIKHGVEIKVVGKEYLDEFMRIMKTTGERDGFNIRPKEYFERMLDSLGDHVRLYMGFYNGQAVCGTITTNYAGKCCYVYGASDNAFRNVMPNYLIQWEMIKWAIETGCEVSDFQGISGNLEDENDHLYGLYRFKRGFNGQVDELPGEFDITYKPLAAKMVKHAIKLNGKLHKLKKKLKK